MNRPTRAQVLELLLGPDGESVFPSEDHRQQFWAQLRAELTPDFESHWFTYRATEPRPEGAVVLKPFAAIAERYARQVTAGEIPACKWVKLACQRHLADLARASVSPNPKSQIPNPSEAFDYEFSVAKAERACRFIEFLPHSKGKWASKGELMVLEPWQIFVVCSIFGWLKRGGLQAGTRRYSLAYIEVPRKNGKSQLAAGIGLYLFCADNEFGAEVYSGATTEKQALEVFRPANLMMARSFELARFLGVDVATKRLSVPADGSRFEPVVRTPGDGASPHGGIVDEYHEHDSDALFDTFRTGMGARQQPLELVITTAGDNMAGPCKLLRGDVEQMLEGSVPADEVFGIIYTIDTGDVWTSETALFKANPNINVSVSLDFLVTEQRAAVAKPRKRGVFQTKHLDVWVGSNMAYFDLEKWKSLGDRELRPEMFIGCPCAAALDLSSKRDFTVRVIGFKKVRDGKDHYFLFPCLYLPQAEIDLPEKQHYKDWAAFIRTTPGNVIDFDLVKLGTVEAVRQFKARELAFDPWGPAEHLVQQVAAETPCEPVKIDQKTRLLSSPMKELDALIADGRVHHDGNPVMNWMVGNVTAHEDANENVFPLKPDGREESKIDGAVAAIMVVSRLMVMSAERKRSVYATRGILTV